MKGVLNETQDQRDMELHNLTGVPLEEIKEYKIAAPEHIKIHGGNEEPRTEKEYLALYEQYRYLNIVGYLRTLMYTSVYWRGKALLKLLRNTKTQVCLDFGSGIGTHAIALLENDNKVDILDVDGPMVRFALKRIRARGLQVGTVYKHNDMVTEGKYDLIICTGVLEHCFNPMKELDRMRVAMKKSGKLFLEVSRRTKPSSGHFFHSIKEWEINASNYVQKYFDYMDGVFVKTENKMILKRDE